MGSQKTGHLPEHIIRESRRARHVNLRISVGHGLEVIIPPGFNRSLIPEILQRKQRWIERTKKRLAEHQDYLTTQAGLPEEVMLQAIGERWRVEYQPTASSGLTFVEEPEQVLLLYGAIQDEDLCKFALQKWLAGKAYQHLVPWLEQISQTEKLSFKRAIVRGQKSRWGSYSAGGTVSLNFKLLFLPPSLVRYVLVHELCHSRHLNHSKKFWLLVSKKEPGYKKAQAELRTAWRHVPGWLYL
jgi:hypothetical protein